MKTTKALFQHLDLLKGEKAQCIAGCPKKSLVIVECIKDFSTEKNTNKIINNANSFVKVIHYGIIGLATSHLISSNWNKI